MYKTLAIDRKRRGEFSGDCEACLPAFFGN